jgi:alkylation response protein AidB-like acyl-CoA dehydrogenase
LRVAAITGTDEYADARAAYRAFMEAHVIPHEEGFEIPGAATDALIEKLRSEAKAAGLWAPHMPPEAHGTGQGFLFYALLNEEIGRSEFGQLIFGCQAPDAGNAEILHQFAGDEQRKRWLKPLVDGDARSFFAMTEPDVSGADPTQIKTRADLVDGEWVINGEKWFATGADGAAFGIVMAATDPDEEAHRRMSLIVVPADTSGVAIRKTPIMGHDGHGWHSHCEISFRDVHVPVSNLLGERGAGFRIAQKRLGPGRIHHVMRWLGQMQRAFDLMCERALSREAFGSRLADKQTIQNWIAESAAEIQACRLMTLDVARSIDRGSEARVGVALLKFHCAKALNDVLDRAVQVHGAAAFTDRSPLGRMWARARGGRIYDGPDEVHKVTAALRILRAYENGERWSFSAPE